MTEFVVGENGVLSWSSPVPPNGVILYYNVIISTADSGQLVTRVEELDILTIDVSNYREMNMDYNVTVMAFEYGFSFMWAFFNAQRFFYFTVATQDIHFKGCWYAVSCSCDNHFCFMTIDTHSRPFLPEAKMHLGVLVKYLTVIYNN